MMSVRKTAAADAQNECQAEAARASAYTSTKSATASHRTLKMTNQLMLCSLGTRSGWKSRRKSSVANRAALTATRSTTASSSLRSETASDNEGRRRRLLWIELPDVSVVVLCLGVPIEMTGSNTGRADGRGDWLRTAAARS